ncbi:hypothetical protein F5148DRAFT_685480 [Russula earlei]|uniref:Uncharacterized protein n=1 Tax=Russula earlei TaxID=71964 RepID=A0ACC0UEE3_9AGAM|nr:hypothetical protein F5148DRAFT_685480 [Russula earlei]
MACAMAWRGMAWCGVACHAIASMITIQDSRSSKTNKHIINSHLALTSPQLVTICLGSYIHAGFPQGFPIASPSPPPISGKSHKHLPLPRSSLPTHPSTTFCL